MIVTRPLLDEASDATESPKKPWGSLLLGLAAFTLIGPGLFAYGTAEFEVTCERTHVVNCSVKEGYLFGAAPVAHSLHDVISFQKVEAPDSATQLKFVMRDSSYTVSALMNLSRPAKRRLLSGLDAYLHSSAPAFHAVESARSFFAFVAVPGTILWALTLFGLVTPARPSLSTGKRRIVPTS